jgi:DNA invertase Pin-like site-specific DNA recombinase
MTAIGYVRVSTDKQAEKMRAMAVVHNAGLLDNIVDGGESAKSLQRPGRSGCSHFWTG